MPYIRAKVFISRTAEGARCLRCLRCGFTVPYPEDGAPEADFDAADDAIEKHLRHPPKGAHPSRRRRRTTQVPGLSELLRF